MKTIRSVHNPLIKHLVKLSKDRKYRYETGSVVVEGKKLVNELCSAIKAKHVLLTDPRLLAPQSQAEEIIEVSDAIMKKVSGSLSPEGIAAELPLPRQSTLEGKKFVLALDGVSDPGNFGTLLRTALALGWDGAFILDNCCDPFNDKALRSAKGATFRLPFKVGSWKELDVIAERNALQPVAADLEGKDADEYHGKKGILLVVGSESKGLSQATLERCCKVTIPMSGHMESLNVSIAGGILMYLLKNA